MVGLVPNGYIADLLKDFDIVLLFGWAPPIELVSVLLKNL